MPEASAPRPSIATVAGLYVTIDDTTDPAA